MGHLYFGAVGQFYIGANSSAFFDQLQQNQAYLARKEADSVSYFWDEMIDRFVQRGDPNLYEFAAVQTNAQLEEGLRLLASETRFRRSALSEALKRARWRRSGRPSGSRGLLAEHRVKRSMCS